MTVAAINSELYRYKKELGVLKIHGANQAGGHKKRLEVELAGHSGGHDVVAVRGGHSFQGDLIRTAHIARNRRAVDNPQSAQTLHRNRNRSWTATGLQTINKE